MEAKTMYKIGEVARSLGLNPQTVYFYERIGLIPPLERTESGYRLFTPEQVERLAWIIRVKSLGLSLEEIKDILTLKEQRSLSCMAVYERLQRKTQEIREQIHKLQVLHDEILPLLKQCQGNLDQSDPTHQCIVLENL